MPYLYSGPEDTLCQLRGCEADEEGSGAGEEREYWDGSRDCWVSHVAARIDPDSVRAPSPPSAAQQRHMLDFGAAHPARQRLCAAQPPPDAFALLRLSGVRCSGC